MLTDFRKKKYVYVFDQFYDYKKKRILGNKDRDIICEKIIEFVGGTAEDVDCKNICETWRRIWNGMLEEIGKEVISMEDFLIIWDNFASNPSAANEWHKIYEDLIYMGIKRGREGPITQDEYVAFYAFYDTNEEEAAAAFKKASKESDVINREDFSKIWLGYFSSDDPKDPGNYLCGVVW